MGGQINYATTMGYQRGQEFLNEFTSEKAMGEEGYLVDKGMIPLTEDIYKAVKSNVKNGVTL